MSNELPFVSVIIPVHPERVEVKSALASRQLDYPREKFEIIIGRSKLLSTTPATKRNAAIKAARGELIYLLDDDSVPLPGNLRQAIPQFRDPSVKMVGGPSLCPPEAPPLEQAFARVMGSWLAFGPSCARYRAVGSPRVSSEKELISCNLLARRDALLEAGGFDESMYPNEENALMDNLRGRGGKLLYEPGLIVYRRPRSQLRSFAKMLLFYGMGRAQQFRLHPTLGSAINFVPPLFCLYVAAVPFLLTWGLMPLVPLLVYGLAVLLQTASMTPRAHLGWSARILPLIVLSNLLYGLGFWRGLLSPLPAAQTNAAADVRLERILP